jgi:flagellar basal-body rod protein FlgC
VDVADIKTVLREPERVFMPSHPEADQEGFVFRAAVDENEEMVEMLEASRQYQNNVEVVSTLRSLMMRTISMGK